MAQSHLQDQCTSVEVCLVHCFCIYLGTLSPSENVPGDQQLRSWLFQRCRYQVNSSLGVWHANTTVWNTSHLLCMTTAYWMSTFKFKFKQKCGMLVNIRHSKPLVQVWHVQDVPERQHVNSYEGCLEDGRILFSTLDVCSQLFQRPTYTNHHRRHNSYYT